MQALYPTPREEENGPIESYLSEESYRELNTLRDGTHYIKSSLYHRLLLYGGGIIWLLLLPTDVISGRIYTDENALLPGTVAREYNGDQKVLQLAEQLDQVAWLVVIHICKHTHCM